MPIPATRTLLLPLVVLAAACSTPTSPAASESSSGGPSASATGPAGRASLAGAVPPLVHRALDLGRMDPGAPLEGISLLFRRSDAQRAASQTLLADLQNPLSPRYHRWLTPAEVASRFGATGAEIARATAWLESQGFSVHGPSPTATRLLFSGTVGQVERAFATEMHRFAWQDEPHFAPAIEPSVPEDLGSFVVGLRGVHDFQWKPPHAARPGASPDDLFDAGKGRDLLTLGPSDFATIYDVAGLYTAGTTGKGQSIAVVGASDYNDADVTAFRTAFGLDAKIAPVRDLVPHSGASRVKDPDYLVEAELDLEWSGAIAQEASVHYVYTGDNPSYGPFDAVVWAIDEDTAPIVTASYGTCEEYGAPSDVFYLEVMGDAAAMEGITVVNSSGDWGPASCDFENHGTAARYGLSPSWPASIPSFTAVGGTMLSWGDPFPEPPVTKTTARDAPFDAFFNCFSPGTPSCAPLGYVPESGWNELLYNVGTLKYFWGASGGGTSKLFTKPYWQVGTTPGTMRTLPDVALTAAWQQVGYLISVSWTAADGKDAAPMPEAFTVSGGTSAAAPSFAGILALVNQALAEQNPGQPVGLGNANPVLYALSASTSGTASPVFHDVTTGDAIIPCEKGSPDCPSSPPYQFGYSAGPGYDLVTGLGSLDAANLVKAWTTLAPTSTALTATPSGTTEGATVTLTATVSSAPKMPAPTGSVLFYVDTTDEGGLADLSVSASAKLVLGTATATVTVPPGLSGVAHAVAFYGGDDRSLASWSTPPVDVLSMSTFALTPSAISVSPNELQTFATAGGVPPITWSVVHDTTCNSTYRCAHVEAFSATGGIYQAGPVDGTTTIAAIDSKGAEARATIDVVGKPIDGGPFPPPWEGGVGEGGLAADAGRDAAAPDSGTMDATTEGGPGAREASSPPPIELGGQSPDRQGCSCRAAGSRPGSPEGASLAGILLAAAASRRRRRGGGVRSGRARGPTLRAGSRPSASKRRRPARSAWRGTCCETA